MNAPYLGSSVVSTWEGDIEPTTSVDHDGPRATSGGSDTGNTKGHQGGSRLGIELADKSVVIVYAYILEHNLVHVSIVVI